MMPSDINQYLPNAYHLTGLMQFLACSKLIIMKKNTVAFTLAGAGVSLLIAAYVINRKKINQTLTKGFKKFRQAYLPGGTLLDEEILEPSDEDIIIH